MRRLAVFAVLIVLASCSPGAGVTVLSPESLPDDLYGAHTPEPAVSPLREVTVYLVRDHRLEPVTRLSATSGSTLDFTLRELFAGPALGESAAGFASAIPGGVSLLGATIVDSVAHVNLSREFELGAEQPALILRVGQVVYTVTRLPDVTSVQFLTDGELLDVLDASGDVRSDPVGRADYAAFAGAAQANDQAGTASRGG